MVNLPGWELGAKTQLDKAIKVFSFDAEKNQENLVYFLVRAVFSIPNISHFSVAMDWGLRQRKNQS